MPGSIHKEDLKLFSLLSIFLFIISSAHIFLQICGNALFISNIGVGRLPLMYVISAFVLAATAIVVIPVIDRMERLRMYSITASSLALGLLSCWILALLNINWTYYLIYVAVYILESFLFLEFWLIASDICHARQAKRIFPAILGIGLIAGTITAFLVKLLAPVIRTENILLVSSLLCGITIPVSRCLSGFFPQKSSPEFEGTVREISALNRFYLDIKIIWQSKLVRILSVSFVLYTVLSFILDYEFNRLASIHFTVEGKVATERLTAFYGVISGWAIACAIFLQFVLSRQVINRAGVCNTYLLMPFIFLFGFLGISMTRVFQGIVLFRFSHKSVTGSLYRSSGALFYNAIPAEKRGRVRAFHNAIVAPLGVALAGGLIMLTRHFLLLPAIFLSLVYVGVAALSLKKNYIASILEMLKEKSGGLWESMSESFGRYRIREISGILENAMKDSDPNIRSFACEIIGHTGDKKAARILLEHLKVEKDNQVRADILKILRDLKYEEARSVFESGLNDNNPRIRKIAIDGLGNTGGKEILKLIEPFLKDRDFSIQAQAIASSWHLEGEKGHLKDLMEELFENKDREAQLASIELAGNIPIPENLGYLTGIVDRGEGTLFLQKAAIKALGRSGAEKACESLIKLLERRDARLSNLIINTLAEMGEKALEPIKKILPHCDIYNSYFLLKALERMARNGISMDRIDREKLKGIIIQSVKQCYYNLYLIEKLGNAAFTLPAPLSGPASQPLSTGERSKTRGVATLLLEDALLEENRKAESNAITGIKILDKNSERMNIISKSIRHPDAFIRANAIEALENIGEPSVTEPFIDILEGKTRFNFPEVDISEILEKFMQSEHNWLCACAIFTIGELRLERFKDLLASSLKKEDALVRANAIEAFLKMGYKFSKDQIQFLQDDPSPLVRKYIISQKYFFS